MVFYIFSTLFLLLLTSSMTIRGMGPPSSLLFFVLYNGFLHTRRIACVHLKSGEGRYIFIIFFGFHVERGANRLGCLLRTALLAGGLNISRIWMHFIMGNFCR
jgi:hypothetical protein